MVKFSKPDWVAHLPDDANDGPLCFRFNENQTTTKVLHWTL